jgi:uncharacterized protein (TIGR02301 family)
MRRLKAPRRFFAFGFALAYFAASPLQAAQKHSHPASAPPPPPPQAAAPAPYEPDLLRLSEIIGALSYMRDLCGEGDGAAWRAKMNALMQAMGDSDVRRQRMAGAYNKGFRDYKLMYRTCTSNARIVISHYLDEGEKLTRDLASRYGSG